MRFSEKVQKFIPKNFQGLANIYSPHTTCCVFQTENELLHLVDDQQDNQQNSVSKRKIIVN